MWKSYYKPSNQSQIQLPPLSNSHQCNISSALRNPRPGNRQQEIISIAWSPQTLFKLASPKLFLLPCLDFTEENTLSALNYAFPSLLILHRNWTWHFPCSLHNETWALLSETVSNKNLFSMSLSSLHYYHSVSFLSQNPGLINGMEKIKNIANMFVLILQEADTKSEIDMQEMYWEKLLWRKVWKSDKARRAFKLLPWSNSYKGDREEGSIEKKEFWL